MKNTVTNTSPCKRIKEMDIIVGHRVRKMRLLMRMSQNELSRHLGLTFQQVQKYERGQNRISAANLYTLSQVFGCPVSWFFGENGDESNNPLSNEELELVRHYRRAPDCSKLAAKTLLQYYRSVSDNQSAKQIQLTPSITE